MKCASVSVYLHMLSCTCVRLYTCVDACAKRIHACMYAYITMHMHASYLDWLVKGCITLLHTRHQLYPAILVCVIIILLIYSFPPFSSTKHCTTIAIKHAMRIQASQSFRWCGSVNKYWCKIEQQVWVCHAAAFHQPCWSCTDSNGFRWPSWVCNRIGKPLHRISQCGCKSSWNWQSRWVYRRRYSAGVHSHNSLIVFLLQCTVSSVDKGKLQWYHSKDFAISLWHFVMWLQIVV